MKDALKEVFLKCAYCDAPYKAVYDGDVEHYRPKGKVKEKHPAKPGYYWLANSWDNLLLSCQHCNQARTREMIDGEEGTYGKMDQFPLSVDGKHITDPDVGIEQEEEFRLLLNPCLDKPWEHIAYEKSECAMVALTPKAEASLEVYAWKRPELVGERKLLMIRLLAQIEVTRKAIVRRDNNPGNQDFVDAFNDQIQVLLGFVEDDQPYAGMCRFFVKEFFDEQGIVLERDDG